MRRTYAPKHSRSRCDNYTRNRRVTLAANVCRAPNEILNCFILELAQRFGRENVAKLFEYVGSTSTLLKPDEQFAMSFVDCAPIKRY